MRGWIGRWWPLFGVVAGVIGYLGWRQFHDDRIEELFAFLPADHGLCAYLDLAAVRSSLRLAGGETIPALLDEKGRLGEHLTALSEAGVEDLALSVGVHEIRAVARGAINADEVKNYIERQGLTCSGPQGNVVCLAESPLTRTEVRLLGGARIEIIDRLNGGRFAPERSQATYLAAPARAGLRGGAVVWVALQPDRLDAAMKDPPRGMINLTLVARALRDAAIAYLVLEPNLASRSLDVRLSALAANPDLAAKTLRVVEDTSNLIAAAVDMGSGDATPNPWSQLLRTGTFTQQDATVDALWRIDSKKLPVLFPESAKKAN